MTALAAAELPPADLSRWSPRRKASIVGAVRDGAIGFAEACRRYQISTEELISLATSGRGQRRAGAAGDPRPRRSTGAVGGANKQHPRRPCGVKEDWRLCDPLHRRSADTGARRSRSDPTSTRKANGNHRGARGPGQSISMHRRPDAATSRTRSIRRRNVRNSYIADQYDRARPGVSAALEMPPRPRAWSRGASPQKPKFAGQNRARSFTGPPPSKPSHASRANCSARPGGWDRRDHAGMREEQ